MLHTQAGYVGGREVPVIKMRVGRVRLDDPHAATLVQDTWERAHEHADVRKMSVTYSVVEAAAAITEILSATSEPHRLVTAIQREMKRYGYSLTALYFSLAPDGKVRIGRSIPSAPLGDED